MNWIFLPSTKLSHFLRSDYIMVLMRHFPQSAALMIPFYHYGLIIFSLKCQKTLYFFFQPRPRLGSPNSDQNTEIHFELSFPVAVEADKMWKI